MSTTAEYIAKISHSTLNGNTYVSATRKVRGNWYAICERRGTYGCNITVVKLTNNPFRGLGKDFKNWDDAEKGYKSGEMKMILVLAQAEINEYFKSL